MTQIFRLNATVRRDPAVDAWFTSGDEIRRLAEPWFALMRACGPDVREVMHDGYPTACVGDAAFAYVGAFKGHANIGFFHGAALADPAGLLEGSGKRMRHVKVRWGRPVDNAALEALISAAYGDILSRLSSSH
ncbi:DUF1801 domain-containing protein [Brevundimonas sp.]|uniref:DUF1801 domain-containing protein n=1 Tax=Brevundimonas sp. TaxID=1871086 RepID=UPI00356374EF